MTSIVLRAAMPFWLPLLLAMLARPAWAEPAGPATPPVVSTDATAPWSLPLGEIEAVLRRELFDPGLLDGPAYAALRAELQGLLASRPQRKQFVKAFNAAWRQGPSSHVSLQPAQVPAAQMAERFDLMDAGPAAVQLSWRGDTAVLAVNTLMGRDTEAAIGAAYREITARPARALIIDLRRNAGGAFAVAPLVGHLLEKAHDSGVFISQRGQARGPVERAVVEQLAPWSGGSLRRFWADVTAAPYTRLRFEPLSPRYAGPVTVLTSALTASAAELAADALLGAGRVQVFGERTAGQMLSQKPFDLPGGLLLFVPVADYHAWHSGRIEGRGVVPTRAMPAEKALDAALADVMTLAERSSQTEAVARRYFEAYIARDWDRLEALLDTHSRFEDATATLVFGSQARMGKAAQMKFFRESYAAIRAMRYSPRSQFASGEHMVFVGELAWSLELANRQVIDTRMPIVVRLQVRDGRVVEHLDTADYKPFVAALRKAQATVGRVRGQSE